MRGGMAGSRGREWSGVAWGGMSLWEEEERRVSQIVGTWSAGLLPPSLSPQAGLGKGPPQ